MDTSPAVEARITERVERLEHLYDRIIGCHVVVQAPHQHSRHGNLFEVTAELRLPGGQPIVAGKAHHEDQAHEDVYVAIRDTFSALERQLQDRVRKARGQVKNHSAPG